MTDADLRRAVPALLAMAAACAQQKAVTPPVPHLTRIDPTSCATATPGEDSAAWQLVSTEQFTFCLPREWKVAGSEATLGGASLTWGTGEQPRGAVMTARVSVPAGGFGREPGRFPDQPPMPMKSQMNHTTEDIGGHSADVRRDKIGAKFFTGAEWGMPRVWIAGTAGSAEEADVEMVVIRSMRFPIR